MLRLLRATAVLALCSVGFIPLIAGASAQGRQKAAKAADKAVKRDPAADINTPRPEARKIEFDVSEGTWMSVDVSPAQLRRPDGLAAVEGALTASGLEPGLLELEITEGVLMETFGKDAEDLLRGLAARGVRLAIDGAHQERGADLSGEAGEAAQQGRLPPEEDRRGGLRPHHENGPRPRRRELPFQPEGSH